MLMRTQPLRSSPRQVMRAACCRAFAFSLALALLGACSSEAPGPAIEVDCRSVDENYDVSLWQSFDSDAMPPPWFGVSDYTPGSMVGVDTPTTPMVENNPVIEAVDDVPELGAQEDGRCGNTFAMVLRAAEFRDWGAFFGDYITAQNEMSDGIDDASGELYDGFSFWARSAPGSDRYFTFAVENWDTSGFGIDGETPDPFATDCVARTSEEVSGETPDPFATDCVARTSEEVSPGVFEETNEYPVGTDPKDACGNPFRKIIKTSDTWRFYTIPWADFFQDSHPNREPGGFNPEKRILRLRISFASDTRNEFWIDDIGLYRAVTR